MWEVLNQNGVDGLLMVQTGLITRRLSDFIIDFCDCSQDCLAIKISNFLCVQRAFSIMTIFVGWVVGELQI